MNRIELIDTLPRVFEGTYTGKSDVWLRHLSLEKGKKYLISAESGGGKSSLCAFLYGYRTDYAGEIRFDGKNIAALSVENWCAIRRRSIAYLPQEMRVFHELTALENVRLKNDLTGYRTAAEIRRMFERLGIADKMDRPTGKLSIGQQQRVAIIRTLCQPADFFLLDEPVSHLDAENNRTVAQMIAEEASQTGAAVIATSVGNNLEIEAEEVLSL